MAVGLVIRSLNRLLELVAIQLVTTHGSGQAAAGLGAGVAAGGAWGAVRRLVGGGGGGGMASGVALVALSALGYSLLGCLYEVGAGVLVEISGCVKGSWDGCWGVGALAAGTGAGLRCGVHDCCSAFLDA